MPNPALSPTLQQQQQQQYQQTHQQPTATIMPLFSHHHNHHQQATLLRLSPIYLGSGGGLSGIGCTNSSRTPSHQYISNPELAAYDIGSRTCLSRRCRQQESSCAIL